MSFRRTLVRFTPNILLDFLRPLACRVIGRIHYSRCFYEEEYHTKDYALPQQNLLTLMARFEETGQKAKMDAALDEIGDLTPANWLEIGCQFGKSTFWLAARYPETFFYMFDFAQTAVEFIHKNNPIPERTKVWQGDVSQICCNNQSLDSFFDMVSMLDFTEHLPKEIYRKSITEALRVLKPGGHLLLKQGNEILPEHINIRWEWQLVRDFTKEGFLLERKLPYRHYLLKKP